MSNDKITIPEYPAVDIDSIALDAARKIAAVDPTKMPGGACQALAQVQIFVRDALELYGTPSQRDLMRRSLSDVVDPNDWAEAFCKFVPGAVLGKVDQDVLASWFGDAIMKGFDIASQRSIKRLTMIYECERIIGDPDATDQMKRRASLTKDALLDRQDHGLALVDRRELDEAKAKLDRAVRALQRSGFQDLGGEEWKPPVNEEAAQLRYRLREVESELSEANKLVGDLDQELVEMEKRKDAAYLERNQVVAALAKCFPSAVTKTAIEGWSEDWHGVVYVQLPTGQASWHFHDSQSHLFDGIPSAPWVWDGHTTPEKYERLALLQIGDAAAGWAWPLPVPEIELTHEQRATLSTASSNLEGVDIDAAHKWVFHTKTVSLEEFKAQFPPSAREEDRVTILHPDPAIQWGQDLRDFERTEMLKTPTPEASALVTAHLKTAGLIAVDMAQGTDTGIQATWEPGKGITSYEVTHHSGEDQKDQSHGESKADEQVMQEKQERKGVHIPGAKWPVPGERRFSLDRRDPMNPANRSDPIERSAKDRRKAGKRDS